MSFPITRLSPETLAVVDHLVATERVVQAARKLVENAFGIDEMEALVWAVEALDRG